MDFGSAAVNGKDDKSPTTSFVVISPDNAHTGSTTDDMQTGNNENNNDNGLNDSYIMANVATGSTTTEDNASTGNIDTAQNADTHLNVNNNVNTNNNGNKAGSPQNVTASVINAKYDEYDQLENQLASLQQHAMQTQRSMAADDKQLKRQIKQSVKNRNEYDDTDTDEYKDLSSTTNSDPTLTTNLGSIVQMDEDNWYYKNRFNILAGMVGFGVISFVFYKIYFQKSNDDSHTFRWLRQVDNDINGSQRRNLNPINALLPR